MTALPQSGRAIVKNIISGDSIVLRGKPVNGPPPEKVLSLSNLVAPRLGSPKDPEKEESFAFESREYLRSLLVGKEVAYKVEYTTTTNQRDFGVVLVQHPIDGETNINRIIAREGWAKVKSPEGKRTATEEQELLASLEAEAQAAKKGIWQDQNTSKGIVRYDVRDDARAFLDKYKGKPIDAILEQVRDGSTFRVCLLLPEGIRQYITLMLSGIKAPAYRKGVPNVEDLVEEYSEEAKYFVESRLLQRDIKVVLEGLSSNDNFVGSVQFPLGNIAEALLGEGLAKVVDWTITMVTGGPQKYRAAEQRAKDRKLRIWKSWVGKAKVGGPEPEFDGIVTRVLSGDTLLVQSIATGKERRIQLSSIRAPKAPEKPQQPTKDQSVKEYGYDFEAREYLRGRCIGKPVHVVIDYIKPADGPYEERECATVTQGPKNLAEVLVAKGLADVIRHRKDDDNRSSQYDQLLIALDRAQKAGKGIHSTKDAPVHRISDASSNVAKARQFFPFLQRSGTISGVVDYVSSGSRFRIYVPSQNCTLTLVLGGIRAPRAGRPGEKSEPYGPEALEFVTRRAMQRDIEFSVEGQDKVGGFIGSLYLTINGERKNVAVMLMEEGYASVHGYSASQSPNAHALYEAEKKAQDAHKGIWKDWTPEDNQPIVEEKPEEDKPIETKDVIVSHIEDGGRIFLQVLGSDLDRLERLMADFSLHHKSAAAPPYQPRNGEYCSAQFGADDQWYRARVTKVNPDKTYNVTYVDYGNSETVPASRIRALDSSFNTMTLNPQASEAKLAYLQVPTLDQDYGEEAFEQLRNLTEGRTLQARILGRVPSSVGSGQALNVVLYDTKNSRDVSVNERLVREGLAIVEKVYRKRFAGQQNAKRANGATGNTAKKSVLDAVMEAQEDAKKSRANMWRYGDFTEDDE
ncbi:uncharacterized protein SPPG_06784 [Spizellomyces punctatus DAOM BR117]|uniref:Endonuclease lcl3 n=1 Tax=Spizellomyces punctatus (strain DAOM BR117) TaxID=645134 RepID=A0A0L0H9B4_SPIPD|nr:uncharacterized protein SPPG_06784 [Spizellomyces punctatus DAOM BR117]KNC97787.1 hypothetical protein SPPG_06784 [Spizellomyces punctatus DAOM BR117]|eukprot:XP_016605827.1 hypothetical protein SPPG_06784 [Spizellomyces punctatus DAOM BR117]